MMESNISMVGRVQVGMLLTTATGTYMKEASRDLSQNDSSNSVPPKDLHTICSQAQHSLKETMNVVSVQKDTTVEL